MNSDTHLAFHSIATTADNSKEMCVYEVIKDVNDTYMPLMQNNKPEAVYMGMIIMQPIYHDA